MATSNAEVTMAYLSCFVCKKTPFNPVSSERRKVYLCYTGKHSLCFFDLWDQKCGCYPNPPPKICPLPTTSDPFLSLIATLQPNFCMWFGNGCRKILPDEHVEYTEQEHAHMSDCLFRDIRCPFGDHGKYCGTLTRINFLDHLMTQHLPDDGTEMVTVSPNKFAFNLEIEYETLPPLKFTYDNRLFFFVCERDEMFDDNGNSILWVFIDGERLDATKYGCTIKVTSRNDESGRILMSQGPVNYVDFNGSEPQDRDFTLMIDTKWGFDLDFDVTIKMQKKTEEGKNNLSDVTERLRLL